MFLPFQDLTLWQIINRLAAFLVVTGVHGFALAGLASLLGDPSARRQGRLTPSPFPHLSIIALVTALLFRFGWIMPMALDARRQRFGRAGLVVCGIGSLLITLALAPLLNPLRSVVAANLSLTAAQTVLVLLDTIQDLAIAFVALNILPIPPLTGAVFLAAVWPAGFAVVNQRPRIAEAIIVVLTVAGVVTIVAGPLNAALRRMLLY